MTKYYLKVILLENCSYSIKAYDLLKKYKLIKNSIIWVNQSNKEKFKTDNIQTFPQIYLKQKKSNIKLLLGGYDELLDIINTFYNKVISDNDIIKWINKLNWSKKYLLRLIQLINQNN